MVRVLKIDPSSPASDVIEEAAGVLRRGGLVAFPTETVYGLGARGLRASEVSRIFAAKKRPSAHPLILHVSDVRLARAVASEWPPEAERLAALFWPGPLTMIVPRASSVPLEVSGGLDTVGIRVPSHAVARALIASVGEPLAAPSANAHMHVSPTTAEHVVASLGDAVDLVLDAGPCAHGIESTVLDVTQDPPRVLRPGALSLGRLREANPTIVYDAMTAADGAKRASPGLASKHYSPRARVTLVDGNAAIAEVRKALQSGGRIAAIAFAAATRDALTSLSRESAEPGELVSVVGLPETADGYGRRLFGALHEVDRLAADVVFIERVPETSEYWAIVDRLRRAATH